MTFAKTFAALTAAAALAAQLASAAVAPLTGSFTGASNHVTTGQVSVTQDAGGQWLVTLGPGFSLDGAPDPKVGFGRDGDFVEGTLIGELRSLTGSQTYRVPAGIDPSHFSEVFIWCEQFSVPLGVASIR